MNMVYLRNVTTLRLDKEKCTGCGICVQVCPHEVLTLRNGEAEIINRDACMECGACAVNCPAGAIDVQRGVGCAAALIRSKLSGGPVTCGCSGETCCG